MKMKNLLLTFALLLGAGSVWAGNKLSVRDVTIAPNGTTKIAIEATFDNPNLIGGQFDIAFPAGISVVDKKLGATGTKHGVSVAEDGGITKIVLADTENNAAFPVGTYILVELTLKASAEVAAGDIKIQNITFSQKIGDAQTGVDLTDATGNKVIVSDKTILDENAIVTPAASDGAVDLRVLRTINANEWSTICLPFEMDATQLKSAFGDDVQLYEFIDYTAEDGNIVVNFDASEELVANWPYVIKTSKAIESFEANATITPDEEGAVAEYSEGKGSKKVIYGTFNGTLSAGYVIPADDLFLNDGKFYYSTGKTVIQGFRGYFEFKDKAADGSRIIMNFDGATGIKNMKANADSDKVFDLQGRQINKAGKGIYIKGGKKVVIK
jgi:hypothetical protein